MTDTIQFEMIFEQDAERLSPTELHEKLKDGSVFFSQLEKIAARLPGADSVERFASR